MNYNRKQNCLVYLITLIFIVIIPSLVFSQTFQDLYCDSNGYFENSFQYLKTKIGIPQKTLFLIEVNVNFDGVKISDADKKKYLESFYNLFFLNINDWLLFNLGVPGIFFPGQDIQPRICIFSPGLNHTDNCDLKSVDLLYESIYKEYEKYFFCQNYRVFVRNNVLMLQITTDGIYTILSKKDRVRTKPEYEKDYFTDKEVDLLQILSENNGNSSDQSESPSEIECLPKEILNDKQFGIIEDFDEKVTTFIQEKAKLKQNLRPGVHYEKEIHRKVDQLIGNERYVNNNLKIRHFFTRFLGNRELISNSIVNINDEKNTVYYHRMEDPYLSACEYYTKASIGTSNLTLPKVNLPKFRHVVTITEDKLYDAYLVYPSLPLEKNLALPLGKIYTKDDYEKINDDISRFFYGFSTALTIQDLDWIKQFYQHLAIRTFYPTKTIDENSRRFAIGADNITRGYAYLFNQRHLAVYVTLNQNHAEEADNSVRVSYNNQWTSLADITRFEDSRLAFMGYPAYFMKVNLSQHWVSINRRTSQIESVNLDDTANANVFLLCLNMKNIKSWLKKLSQNRTMILETSMVRQNLYILNSYLNDLFIELHNDSNDNNSMEENYPNLYRYLYNMNTIIEEAKVSYENNISRLPSISETEFSNVRSEFLRRYSTQFSMLSESECFDQTVVNELLVFWDSKMRKKYHTKRFLFNICYLKIMYYETSTGNDENVLVETIERILTGDMINIGSIDE